MSLPKNVKSTVYDFYIGNVRIARKIYLPRKILLQYLGFRVVRLEMGENGDG